MRGGGGSGVDRGLSFGVGLVGVGGRSRLRAPPSQPSPDFHPSGWLRASALTCRLIPLVGVKWSCLRINKQAFPPLTMGGGC